MHKPRLLSDNGASYISGELADYIKEWPAPIKVIHFQS
jgi:hypothetical protein